MSNQLIIPMLRRQTITVCKRLYHDSRFNEKKLAVKAASARTGRAIKQRLDSEVKVQGHAPTRTYEPFPFAVTDENKLEVLNKIVSPLHDIPYNEQLSSKASFCKNILRYIGQELYKNGTPVRLDVNKLPCHVNPIVHSPVLYNYRSKDEYSIWRGLDGQTNTVGYLVFPLSKHGDSVCVEPNGCKGSKEDVFRLTDILQEFITHQAKVPVSYDLGQDGGWRRFCIKSNEANELMLIGYLNPRTLSVQQVIDERENFADFVSQRAIEANLKLKSIYFQPCPHNKCQHKDVPYELVYGDKTLEGIFNGLKHLISPETFLPQSSKGAEVLYKTIQKTIDECFSAQKPMVIDPKCGSGVLLTQFANQASKLIGIDSNPQFIDEARENAKLNNLNDYEFICSNIEIVLERVLEKYRQYRQNALLVCSLPSEGLNKSAISAIRKCQDVKKIVFTTSNNTNRPLRFKENIITLCQRGKGESSPPFVPISATPVDIYPHTQVCELVMALERLPE